MMKIAYINFFYSQENMAGVEKKLIDEAKYYTEQYVDVFLLNNKKDGFFQYIHYKKITNYFSMPSWLSYFYIRLFTFSLIDKIIPIEAYDKIYIRYPLMDLSALHFGKKYGQKIVTQHHTKELEEIQKYHINKLFKIFQYILEKYLAPRFFRYVYALTAMTDEVIAYEQKRLSFQKKTYRFSNGIAVDAFKMHTPPILTKEFHLTIVASHYAPWHGLDRVLKSLRGYRHKTYAIYLHIVGKIPSELLTVVEEFKTRNMIFVLVYGKLDTQDLDNVFAKTHMACDSLAMYRLNMNESSTLKSKEYIARGIPYLYSAEDKDMQIIEKYLYNVGNNDSIIDFDAVIEHYESLNIRTMQKEMAVCVKNNLSWEKKVSSLVDFLSETCESTCI